MGGARVGDDTPARVGGAGRRRENRPRRRRAAAASTPRQRARAGDARRRRVDRARRPRAGREAPLGGGGGRAGGEVERFEIAVAPKTYASQHLKVPPDQVDLSAEDLARYERERVHLAEVLRTFSDSAPATLAMLQPAPRPR